jgi:predicted transcriptional regulator
MVGNLSNFTKIDILRCLLRIQKPVSRSFLSESLDLGEGTIRAILNILKETDLLESNKQGHHLSAKGNNIINRIKNSIDIKEAQINIFPDKKKIAIHLRNIKEIKSPVMLRDAAVKNGADGALILKFTNKLEVIDSDYEQDLKELEDIFQLNKDDLIILAYADSYKLAEHGALAVAVELNNELKNIVQGLKYSR